MDRNNLSGHHAVSPLSDDAHVYLPDARYLQAFAQTDLQKCLDLFSDQILSQPGNTPFMCHMECLAVAALPGSGSFVVLFNNNEWDWIDYQLLCISHS